MRKLKEFMTTTRGRVVVAVPVLSTAVATALPSIAFASDASGASADAGAAVDLFSKVTSLFTTYPLNIYIGGGLVIMALGIFASAKRTSKH